LERTSLKDLRLLTDDLLQSSQSKGANMKVWVDQDICTGDGLCAEECPSMFTMKDNLSYVRTPQSAPTFQGGAHDLVDIPAEMLDAVLDAAEECPGECIFIEA
jgi:ferredoxin